MKIKPTLLGRLWHLWEDTRGFVLLGLFIVAMYYLGWSGFIGIILGMVMMCYLFFSQNTMMRTIIKITRMRSFRDEVAKDIGSDISVYKDLDNKLDKELEKKNRG